MQVQNRLVHILRQATDASDDNIRALIDQASALEKVGVVSQEAIMAAQGTLATFDLLHGHGVHVVPDDHGRVGVLWAREGIETDDAR